jgi:hypothetical protein
VRVCVCVCVCVCTRTEAYVITIIHTHRNDAGNETQHDIIARRRTSLPPLLSASAALSAARRSSVGKASRTFFARCLVVRPPHAPAGARAWTCPRHGHVLWLIRTMCCALAHAHHMFALPFLQAGG